MENVGKWPYALKDALGRELAYPGYRFRLLDGTTVHAGRVNRKHGPGIVTVYRGHVDEPDGTRRDLARRGEDFIVAEIAEAWKDPQ
jgi:hypothetical protein